MQVYVFTFGVPRFSVESICDKKGLIVVEGPSYRSALQAYCEERAELFSCYPVLHKWLVLKYFSGSEHGALLYVDTDICFLSNPTRLFDDNVACHWYTREEPYCSHSHLGYDSRYLNEATLSAVATRLGRCVLPPMNIGVVLMNHFIWKRIENVLNGFFTDMWRFLVWLVHHGDQRILREPRMRPVLDMAAAMVTAEDLEDGITYPSSNGWILDEITMLLTLGRFQDFTWEFFDRGEVLQGYEFAALDPGAETHKAVLCHYYSKNQRPFAAWYEKYLQPAKGMDLFGKRVGRQP
jgi:hypothetical protein